MRRSFIYFLWVAIINGNHSLIIMESTKYIYPVFSAKFNLGFARVGGCGLANCLYTYAKAASIAHKNDLELIAPTWLNLSIGTYLRHQSDKRHYLGLIHSKGEIHGLQKILYLLFKRNQIQSVFGLGNYFRDLIEDAEYVSKYIVDHIEQRHKAPVDAFDFTGCVGIHVRLGDYNAEQRIPLSWYIDKVNELRGKGFARFLLFSDGTDSELEPLMKMVGVERVFFGSAISDIYAMSKCSYIIGSDSTFSGWAAFLGQVPCCFKRKHYGPVLKDRNKEIVEE